MRNYEVTFIVDPVLSGEEIKTTAQTYSDMLKNAGAEIVHIDEMGLRTLAYPINKRNSGVYYCIEFKVPNGEIIDDLELALRRDERIMRFLSFKLDKFGIKYNEDKRAGKIGKAKRPKSKEKKDDRRDRRGRRDNRDRDNRNRDNRDNRPAAEPKKSEPKKPEPAQVEAKTTEAAPAPEAPAATETKKEEE